MEKEKQVCDFSVKCGKALDCFETLQKLCEKEAEKLSKTIDVPKGRTVSVTFWTSDVAELIGVGIFEKDMNGIIKYHLDFSETTL